eukprot:7391443-Alexandrium_andersonii.AAC.1
MGGPVKPFLWAVGFDPVIYAVEVLAGGPAPTYVDDLAVLLRRLLGLRRASMAVLWAAKAAGLVVDLHHCRGAVVTNVTEAWALALTRVQCKVLPCDKGWRVTGCSADAIGWLLHEADCVGFQHRCRCK